MVFERDQSAEPCYVISIAARMVGLHAQTLRYYERAGLLSPSRSLGRQRLYSPLDVQRILRIKALTEDMGVNLAGAEVALRLMAQIKQLQAENESLKNEIRRLKSRAGSEKRTARRRVS